MQTEQTSIDITPTWAAILPVLIHGLESKSRDARDIAKQELQRMAQAADNWNAHARKEKKPVRIRCIDAQSTTEDAMTSADDENVKAPYRVFDIVDQSYVGPEFNTRAEADAHMAALGGAFKGE